MAFSDLTFKLYTDSGLTTLFSGLYQLVHNTDQSDNPQDFQLWLGSNTAGKLLRASSNPGIDQLTLTPTYILDEWVASTAYVLGNTIEPTTPNTYRYECTTAGTSDSGEPTWPTTSVGETVVDGTVVWTLASKAHPITEVKLALTAGGLPGATGGALVNLGTSIANGTGAAVEINLRITNSVVTAGANTGYPELALYINSVVET